MATRRKYRSAPTAGEAAAAPSPPPAMPDAPPDANALQQALEAQQHAEELHRQHGQRAAMGLPEPQLAPEQRQQIEALVDGIPNLTEHQRRFLKSHPSLLHEPYLSLMRHAIVLARHAGVPEDTPEFDQAILAGIARDIEHHRNLSSAQARSMPPPLPDDAGQAAEALQREAESHLAADEPPPPPKRRSMPMSAPVSRDIPMPSGRSRPGQITLDRDERDIAAVSFPHLSKDQAEYEYAKNKKRMHEMKAAGLIQGDR